jgi:hypothetical protein
MSEKIRKATHGSPDKLFKIGDMEIRLECYVLDDGTRVLSGRGMQKAMGLGQEHGSKFKAFLKNKEIAPFISENLSKILETPIKFIRPGRGGKVASGYEATVLQKICDVVLQARKKGKLTTPKDLLVAEQCEILTRVFAKVGIIALVDEITGYQNVRDREALYRILKVYVREELLPWAKTFPDEFYKELFRLHNWTYDPENVKRPGVIGTWTNKLIYERLPEGVLEELQKKNPRTYKRGRRFKHFQFLTEDIGNPHLRGHLQQVIVLMRISPNWRVFLRHFVRAFPLKGDQFELEGQGFELESLENN